MYIILYSSLAGKDRRERAIICEGCRGKEGLYLVDFFSSFCEQFEYI